MQYETKHEIRETSLKDLFHLIKQVLPDLQDLVTLPPETLVVDALKLMRERNFSQIPIVEGDEVLGVFSYRSFAEGLVALNKVKTNPLCLTIEEFPEKLSFVQITDEVIKLLDEFDLKDAVLIGSENNLQGIITATDALRYFYKVASEYIMFREVELAIRALIKASVNEEELEDCINKSLKEYYKKQGLEAPKCLEDMSMQDYITILRRSDSWTLFSDVFGIDRRVVYAKLESLPNLRNEVFHFRRKITVEEYDKLRSSRDWLLNKISKLEARMRRRTGQIG